MAHSETELGAFIDRAQRSLFRLEALDRYDVSSDGGDFASYMAGDDGPDPDRKAAWHRVLKADKDRGIVTRRVHVVRSPLSDYLRFEFEWGYAHNLAYEDIRVLDAADGRAGQAEPGWVSDFWLVDGSDTAVMHYDDAGRFTGFHRDGPSPWATVAEIVWDAATPFAEYWDAHRQYWRGSRHAA